MTSKIPPSPTATLEAPALAGAAVVLAFWLAEVVAVVELEASCRTTVVLKPETVGRTAGAVWLLDAAPWL